MFSKTLSRDEMKSIKAGGGNCGNIYCTSGGVQYYCTSGSCDDENVDELLNEMCINNCMERGDCGGCAQFPQVN